MTPDLRGLRVVLAVVMVIPVPLFALPSIVGSGHSLLPFTAAVTSRTWPVVIPAGYVAAACLVAFMPVTARWRLLAGATYLLSYLGFWVASLTTGDATANGPSGPSLLLLVVMLETIIPLLAMLAMAGTLVSFLDQSDKRGD